MPGITVFGQIAIVVGGVFVGPHYALLQCTQPFSGDLIIGTLGVTTALGYALIKAPRNPVTRFLVRVAFVWSGLAFLAGFTFVGQFVLHQAGFVIGDGTVWLCTGLLGLLGYHRAKNPQTRHRRVEGDYEESLRVLQLTDLHVGDIWSKADLARIVRKATHYRPDCVVITGDLLDGMEPVAPDLVAPLQAFDVPVYFVSGNHDSYTEREALLDALSDIGVVPLEGDMRTTRTGSVLGLGYDVDPARAEALADAFADAQRPRITLKHKPDALAPLLGASPDAIL
ncbi:MAG: metallophosphoesterase, partial [Salinibacter sp.]